MRRPGWAPHAWPGWGPLRRSWRMGALVLAVTAARADATSDLVNRMYAKIADSFSAGKAFGRDGDFLLLACPGTPVEPDLLRDPSHLARLADRIPLVAKVFLPGTRTVTAVYSEVLSQAEVTLFQDQVLRNKARLAHRVLFDRVNSGRPTREYQAYYTCREAWEVAADNLAAAQAEQATAGRPVPAGLQATVTRAREAWVRDGHKDLIERAEADLARYYDAETQAWFTGLREAMAPFRHPDGHNAAWYPVESVPPPPQWPAEAGWKAWHFSQHDRMAAGASAGAAEAPLLPPGLLRALPPVPGPLAASMDLSLEFKRVRFSRPWYDQGLERNRGWRMPARSGFRQVSSGKPLGPEPGVMPLKVTGALLARKVVLIGDGGAGDATRLAGLQALGPIRLKGDGAGSALRTTVDARSRPGKVVISVEGMQILGWFCETVPLSPNPDPDWFR